MLFNCILVLAMQAPSREPQEHLLHLEVPRGSEAPTRLSLAFGLSCSSTPEEGTGVHLELEHSPDGTLWFPVELWGPCSPEPLSPIGEEQEQGSEQEGAPLHRCTLEGAQFGNFVSRPLQDLMPHLRVKAKPFGRRASSGVAAARAPELALSVHVCSDGKVQRK